MPLLTTTVWLLTDAALVMHTKQCLLTTVEFRPSGNRLAVARHHIANVAQDCSANDEKFVLES